MTQKWLLVTAGSIKEKQAIFLLDKKGQLKKVEVLVLIKKVLA